jgi:hypothetical protein
MKTYIPILFYLIMLLSSSPLRAQKSAYTLPFENSLRLPAMETAINLEEIAATYQTVGNIYTTQITGIGEESMEQTSVTHISDVKALDAIRFLEFYLQDELLDRGSPSGGLVEMSVIYFDEDTRWNLGSALGILTFGVAMLVGVPHSTAVVDVEVDASFYDDAQALTATHRGVGRSKRLLTIYSQSGSRKAHQKALKRALEDLNEQIMRDPFITGNLPSGTP